MKCKFVLLWLLAALCAQGAWGYDFSAVSPSGHTLYYSLAGGTAHVAYRGPMHAAPAGHVVVPATVSYYGVTYAVTGLDSSAFLNCAYMTQVVLPATVTEVGDHAFKGCSSLHSITLPAGLKRIGAEAFRGCVALDSLALPDSVMRIGAYAFEGCSGLEWVQLPARVVSIGSAAFRGCRGLTDVELPDMLDTIGGSAFEGCSGLRELQMPGGVKVIGESAFRGCWQLSTVMLPATVTTIGSQAFAMLPMLYYRGTATGRPWGALGLNGYEQDSLFYSDSARTLVVSAHRMITAATVPDRAINLGRAAFWRCQRLAQASVGRRVQVVGDSTFKYCTALQSVVLGDSVRTIGADAFYGDTSLTAITLPYRTSTIGQAAFRGCSHLAEVVLNDSLRQIGMYAFRDCESLSSVRIPSGVSIISSYAFYEVPMIFYGGSATGSPWGARYMNGFEADSLFYADSALTQLVAGHRLLRAVELPNRVTFIGMEAFRNCRHLMEVVMGDSVTVIDWNAFMGCTALENVIFSPALRRMLGNTFMDCPLLEQVVLPQGLRYIGQGTFSGCQRLAQVTFNEGLDSIDRAAFYDCASLTEVSLPRSLKLIWTSAFYRCSSLSQVNMASSAPPTLGEDAFPMGTVITVPCEHWVNYNRLANTLHWAGYVIRGGNGIMYSVVVDQERGAVEEDRSRYCSDSILVLTAVPHYGYRFSHWADGDSSNPRTIRMTCDSTFRPLFVRGTYRVSVVVNDSAWGTIRGEGDYEYQATAQLWAFAKPGYHFSAWGDGSRLNPRSITVLGDTVLTARFLPEGVGIADVPEDALRVWTRGAELHVQGCPGREVQVMDMAGRRVAGGQEGRYTLPAPGVYIVRIGESAVRKVVAVW